MSTLLDSCSSTIGGWRTKQVQVDKNILPPPPSLRPPLPPRIENTPCPNPLDTGYCENGGKCVMILHEPTCINCNEGYEGRRCMDKSLEGYYNVIVQRTLSTSTTSTSRPRIDSDLNVPILKCPEVYDKEFCLNGGKCVMIHEGFQYMCICKHPFMGMRCEDKGIEGSFRRRKRLNRKRRRVLSK